MKLHCHPVSPYARKAMILIRLKGLDVEEVTASADDANGYTRGANPIGKIPALERGEHSTLVDSPLICEYIHSLKTPLMPTDAQARFEQMRLHALGDAISDATYNYRYEIVRDEALHWPKMIERHETALRTIIAALEYEVDALGTPWEFGNLSIVCALDYMSFRAGHIDWRALAPKLATWYKPFVTDAAWQSTYAYDQAYQP